MRSVSIKILIYFLILTRCSEFRKIVLISLFVPREGAAIFNYKRPRLTATTPVGEEQPALPAPTSAPTPGASRIPDSDSPRQREETGRDKFSIFFL